MSAYLYAVRGKRVNIYNAPVQTTTPVRPDSERISEEEFTKFENF